MPPTGFARMVPRAAWAATARMAPTAPIVMHDTSDPLRRRRLTLHRRRQRIHLRLCRRRRATTAASSSLPGMLPIMPAMDYARMAGRGRAGLIVRTAQTAPIVGRARSRRHPHRPLHRQLHHPLCLRPAHRAHSSGKQPWNRRALQRSPPSPGGRSSSVHASFCWSSSSASAQPSSGGSDVGASNRK